MAKMNKGQPNWVTEYNSQGERVQNEKLIRRLITKLNLVKDPKKPGLDKPNKI